MQQSIAIRHCSFMSSINLMGHSLYSGIFCGLHNTFEACNAVKSLHLQAWPKYVYTYVLALSDGQSYNPAPAQPQP